MSVHQKGVTVMEVNGIYDRNPDIHQTPEVLTGYKDLLSVEDLSFIFEVSKQTIYKEMKDGKFGIPIQIGRAYKIPKIYILRRYFHCHEI
jgi:predicted DNA-binding transcriptional regulator AlpA